MPATETNLGERNLLEELLGSLAGKARGWAGTNDQQAQARKGLGSHHGASHGLTPWESVAECNSQGTGSICIVETPLWEDEQGAAAQDPGNGDEGKLTACGRRIKNDPHMGGRGEQWHHSLKRGMQREEGSAPPALELGGNGRRHLSCRRPRPGSLPRELAREGGARAGCPVWYWTSG